VQEARDTFVGRGPLGIAEVELAWRSLSNFSFTRDSSVSKSTDVDCDTFSGSFLTFGAARRGSGFCRTGGINSNYNPRAKVRPHTKCMRVRFPALPLIIDLWSLTS
jgi:hypothetical protein